MRHHKIKGERDYLLRTKCRDARRYKISGIHSYVPRLRLLYWNVPHEPFVEVVVSALTSYLNLTNMNFIPGKYLVEFSLVGYVFLFLVYLFLSLSMCCLCILRRGYPDWVFSVLFPQL